MNSTQIKYFIEAARCLNFSEAARRLYISQPALSQQITSIEAELNMQLFIRQKNKLRLTPAAKILLEELPEQEKQFQRIIDKAKIANNGNQGTIKMGILQGQVLTEDFQNIIWQFRKEYPGVFIEFGVDSFGGLRRKLDLKELDIIYTTDFDVCGKSNYSYEKIGHNIGAALIAKRHPLAEKRITSLKDLANEVIVIIDEDESEIVKKMIIADCKAAGFVPNLILAENLNQQQLWIETGVGVGIINVDSYIYLNPNVKVLEELEVGQNYYVIAWHKEHENTAIMLFTNYVSEYLINKF